MKETKTTSNKTNIKKKNIIKQTIEDFKSINWPKNERVKKEYLIVMIGTLIFSLSAAGIDFIAQRILNLIY